MKTAWVIRYGEIGTKSKGIRKMFIERLIRNIEDAMRTERIEYKSIKSLWSRILLYSTDPKVRLILPRIFGIKSVSEAYEVKASLDEITKAAFKIVRKANPKTFKVDTQRITKDIPMTSIQINSIIGEKIVEEYDIKVDLENPDLTIGIEIISGKAFVFDEKIPGPGGLPLGVEGRVLAILEDEDDLIAAWLMMKRGCEIFPITTKLPEIYRPLRRYAYGNKYDIMVVDSLTEKTLRRVIEEYECLGVCVGGKGKSFLENVKKLRILGLPIYTPSVMLPDEIYEEIRRILFSEVM